MANVSVKVETDEQTRAAFIDALDRLIGAQDDLEEAQGVVIDNGPQPALPRVVRVPEPEPPPPRTVPRLVMEHIAPEKTDGAVVSTPAQARERAMAPSFPPPINGGEPSTTEKYLDWAGRTRNQWKPF